MAEALLNLKNVCRLCSSKINLVSIFDKKLDFPQSMAHIILQMTTIKIVKEDEISQKICSKCVAVTIKLFQFRDQAITNDKTLREQYKKILKSQGIEVPDSPTTSDQEKDKAKIKEPTKEEEKLSKPEEPAKEEKKVSKPEEPAKEERKLPKPQIKPLSKSGFVVHSSVKELFKTFPQIRLPTICLKANINPRVTMEMDAVENYFKKRKLNMNHYAQLSMTQNRVAKKRTAVLANQLLLKKRRLMKRNDVANENINISRYNSKQTNGTESSKPIDDIKSPHDTKRKRNLSDSSVSSQQSAKRPFLDASSSSCPSASPAHSNFSDDISDVAVSRSQELHICNICNSVHYQASALKKHQVKHLRCQFCKVRFKSLETKEKHVESECKIQKAMKGMVNSPSILLKKIDLDLELRKKHLKALSVYPPIAGLEDLTAKKDKRQTNDIIEIMSDEEDNSIQPSPLALITQYTPTLLLQNKFIPSEIEITDGILSNCLKEADWNDIKLAKNLMLLYNKLHKKEHDSSQTILPSNKLIKMHQADFTAELISLKCCLCYYKIPIEINRGTQVKLSYKYDSRIETIKKFKNWNDLVPIDVNIKETASTHPDPSFEILFPSEVKVEEAILVEDIYNQSNPVNVLVIDDSDSEMNEDIQKVLLTHYPNVVNSIPNDSLKLSMHNSQLGSDNDNILESDSNADIREQLTPTAIGSLKLSTDNSQLGSDNDNILESDSNADIREQLTPTAIGNSDTTKEEFLETDGYGQLPDQISSNEETDLVELTCDSEEDTTNNTTQEIEGQKRIRLNPFSILKLDTRAEVAKNEQTMVSLSGGTVEIDKKRNPVNEANDNGKTLEIREKQFIPEHKSTKEITILQQENIAKEAENTTEEIVLKDSAEKTYIVEKEDEEIKKDKQSNFIAQADDNKEKAEENEDEEIEKDKQSHFLTQADDNKETTEDTRINNFEEEHYTAEEMLVLRERNINDEIERNQRNNILEDQKMDTAEEPIVLDKENAGMGTEISQANKCTPTDLVAKRAILDQANGNKGEEEVEQTSILVQADINTETERDAGSKILEEKAEDEKNNAEESQTEKDIHKTILEEDQGMDTAEATIVAEEENADERNEESELSSIPKDLAENVDQGNVNEAVENDNQTNVSDQAYVNEDSKRGVGNNIHDENVNNTAEESTNLEKNADKGTDRSEETPVLNEAVENDNQTNVSDQAYVNEDSKRGVGDNHEENVNNTAEESTDLEENADKGTDRREETPVLNEAVENDNQTNVSDQAYVNEDSKRGVGNNHEENVNNTAEESTDLEENADKKTDRREQTPVLKDLVEADYKIVNNSQSSVILQQESTVQQATNPEIERTEHGAKGVERDKESITPNHKDAVEEIVRDEHTHVPCKSNEGYKVGSATNDDEVRLLDNIETSESDCDKFKVTESENKSVTATNGSNLLFEDSDNNEECCIKDALNRDKVNDLAYPEITDDISNMDSQVCYVNGNR